MRLLFTLATVCLCTAAHGQTTVNMVNYKFEPAKVTVTAGTKVTWVNKGDMQHTSTSGTGCKGDGKWNSGNVDPGKSFTYTFESEGTYSYFCTPHCGQGMMGVVEVKGKKTGGTDPAKKNDDGMVAMEPAPQTGATGGANEENTQQAAGEKKKPQR